MNLHYANNAQAYNGNIGSVQWNTKVSGSQTQTPLQTYTYTYDKLNRLKKAAYSATNKVNHYDEELAYDVMGNIDTLRRTRGGTGWYNHFKYSYTGNRLNGVSDIGTANRDNSFTYDVNGNAKTNTRLGITDIAYNYLNLPKKFVKGSQQLVYTYDATGKKLKKTLGSAVTDYVDGIQYKNGVLEFIQTEEGRILPSGSSFVYEYFLRDHLGNTRAIVDHTGAVKQIQDYYAFGMEMNTGAGLNSASNHYKYNGKEKQVELGLDQLDYGARFYDAEIGRWNVVDPLAEKYSPTTPYAYAINNPIMFVDPDGRDIKIWYKVNHNGVEKSRYFVFNGNNFKDAPDNYFVKSFIQAYNYNIENGGGDNLLKAATSTAYTINLQRGEDNSSTYKTVFWNPFEAAEYLSNTDEKMILSPATILEHEFDHSVSKKTDLKGYELRKSTPDKTFTNKEEEGVIKGSEMKTGQKNGEIKAGQYRKDHNERLRTIRVGDPTSTKEFKYPWENPLNNSWNNF